MKWKTVSAVRCHKAPERQQRGETRLSETDWLLFLTESSLYLTVLRAVLFLSEFYIRPEWLLCNADESVEVCSEGKKWCSTHLANSWRPSSRRWDVPLSLAPSDAMRKWMSLNRDTWSSVWGCVTWSSSRQRSFTDTPNTHWQMNRNLTTLPKTWLWENHPKLIRTWLEVLLITPNWGEMI